MPMLTARTGRTALLAGATLFAMPATAQSVTQQATSVVEPTGDDGGPAATDGGSSDDILVTARRRTERSQDVPIAINAFGAAQIESTRTSNLRDLQQLTASLVVTNNNPRNTSINIRGLRNNVVVYNDGVEPAAAQSTRPCLTSNFRLFFTYALQPLLASSGSLMDAVTCAIAEGQLLTSAVRHFPFQW